MMLVQYVNPACARALNYSAPGELVGRHVDEALTSDKNPIDIYAKIQQQLDAGQVRCVTRLIGWWRSTVVRASVFRRRTFPVLRSTCS